MTNANVHSCSVRLFALLLLAAMSSLHAQETGPCVALRPTPCMAPAADAPSSTPSKSPVIARMDGVDIRLSDLDEATRRKVEAADAEAASARRAALRREVDDVLFELEAARRGTTAKDLLASEVLARTRVPSADEVARELAAHPDKYKRGKDDAERAAGSLYDARFDELTKALIASIETRFPVTIASDPSRPAGGVVATVGPRSITLPSISGQLDAAEADVRIAAAESERQGLDDLINERLLKLEAMRRKQRVDEVTAAEVTAKIVAPTNADLESAWTEWKSFFDPDFETARPAVSTFVQRERTESAEKAFYDRLRTQHSIEVLFEIPKRPSQSIRPGSAPSRGDRDAAVTVVEWGDFQCPPCAHMAVVMEKALAPFGDRVRYVFEQWPNSFHEHAWKAAEAALAANAQGKFFPYAQRLFANQNDLTIASLERYAKAAGLDEARFRKDVEGGRYAAEVLWEKREGTRVGVRGTPFFFVNGVRLGFDAYTVDGIRTAIEAALAKTRTEKKID